jgi:hypothetical protein
MNIKVKTKFNWQIVYIWIPLLPFLLGGFVRSITIILSHNFDLTMYNVFRTLYFSWDTVALSFSISIMAFIVKNNLLEQRLCLSNEDRKKDLADNSSWLFLYGFFNLFLFSILLIIHTILINLNIKDMKNIHIVFSLIIYIVCYFTIRKIRLVQKNYNLTANFL